MGIHQTKVGGRVDFDVIINGKYMKRVGRGILFEQDGDNVISYLGGDTSLVFAALFGLTLFVTNNDLKEEFDKFVQENLK